MFTLNYRLYLVFALLFIILFEGSAQFKNHIDFTNKIAKTQGPGIVFPKKYLNELIFSSRFDQVSSVRNKRLQFKNSNIENFNELRYEEGYDYPSFMNISIPNSILISENATTSSLLVDCLRPFGEVNFSFSELNSEVDEYGIKHIQAIQTFNNTPIYLGDIKMHIFTDNVIIQSRLNNITNEISPKLSKESASSEILKFLDKMSQETVKFSVLPSWEIEKIELNYYYDQNSLSWHIGYVADCFSSYGARHEVILDGINNEILHHFSKHCKFHNHPNELPSNSSNMSTCDLLRNDGVNELVLDPGTGTGNDLLNVNRTFNIWREGSKEFMIDASKKMFKLSSNVPNNPIGVIITRDENGGSPFTIESSNKVWPAKGISAHFNLGLTYDYFLSTHNRNSISNNGNNIISLINVRDPDNGSLNFDNAFWNGRFISFGNGGAGAFLKPLCGALDVAAHELTHGVIEATANLVYQNESGAINESFADIFGVMIDRADWGLAEDVANRAVFNTGLMRDVSDPHNGNGNGRQPNHVREQFFGTGDNGGVHINSGISNFAFFKFVQLIASGNEEQGKKLAEVIYYRALTKYLTRSSNFKDLRSAVEQAAKDIHGANSTIVTAVGTAYDAVGIMGTSGGGGNTKQNDLTMNPGPQFILHVGNNNASIKLLEVATNKLFTISNQTAISKPVASDNGNVIVFVNDKKQLIALVLNANGAFDELVIGTNPIFRNAAVSKQGNLIAYLKDVEENKIYIFDVVKQVEKEFVLVNPATNGAKWNNIKYADFLEFDHSGEVLMFDCLNTIKKPDGSVGEYWDIGFINVFNRSTQNFGDGNLFKIFRDLPLNVSIGDPVFSKNSPYIIAFDIIDQSTGTAKFSTQAVNIETGSLNILVSSLSNVGFPNYSVDDKKLILDNFTNVASSKISSIQLGTDKISSTSNPSNFLINARWGSWIAFGERVLTDVESNLSEIKDAIAVPNPSLNSTKLQFYSAHTNKVTLRIYDILGNLVYSNIEKSIRGINILDLKTENLKEGIYTVNIDNLNSSLNLKLLKL